MTEKEAAEYLGISLRRLIYWRLRNVGPKYTHNFKGRSRKRLQISYDRKDLLAFKKKIEHRQNRKKELIPADEAALYLNIHSATLSKWRKKKINIPFFKIDDPCIIKDNYYTKYFYRKEDLDIFLSKNSKKPEYITLIEIQKKTGVNRDILKKLRDSHQGPTFFITSNDLYYNKGSAERYIEIKNKERKPKTFKTGFECIICGSNKTYWEGSKKEIIYNRGKKKIKNMPISMHIDGEFLYCSDCGMKWRY